MRLPVRLLQLAPVGVLALLGLVACSSEEPQDAGREDADAQSKILQPGRPGEGNETLDSDATVEEPATNDADVTFVQMMIPHHAQALEMSELAQTRARDEQVVAISRRIKGAQGPEIVAMASWLESRDLEVPESLDDLDGSEMPGGDHSDHGADHGTHQGEGHGHDGDSTAPTMPGMLSDAQMTDLAQARGAEFDRLFLAGMIRHHKGAVSMAHDELGAGSDTLALELASDVAAGQQAEIGRMLDIRRTL